eukprot:Hpha_TRINITY_DN11551_c0_g1::TRINITY_DN11551_c0_g1_i1::g.32322::m.32322
MSTSPQTRQNAVLAQGQLGAAAQQTRPFQLLSEAVEAGGGSSSQHQHPDQLLPSNLEQLSREELVEQLHAMSRTVSSLQEDLSQARRRLGVDSVEDTPQIGAASTSPPWGMQVFSEGTMTPTLSMASPLLLPSRTGQPPQTSNPAVHPPAPAGAYKLSSQVLTVGQYGIKQSTLMQVLLDARGRSDRRGADTPVCQPSAPPAEIRHRDVVTASSDEDAASNEVGSNGQPQGSDEGVRPGPARRSPPPPLDHGAVGRAAVDGPLNNSLNSISSPILPMTPGALDRIATVFSLEALRSDKMLAQHIPLTARAAMDYVSKAYNLETGEFYHDNERFYKVVCHLADEVIPVLQRESLYQKVHSPCYVFGDIHGNFRDLHYFLNNIVNFQDLHYTPSNVLFLGDYVDRGPHGLECSVLLLGLKLSCPSQVHMLRGNHEDPLVNGDIRHYGSTAFLKQCQTNFGAERGQTVWKKINDVFKHLPLAADIDGRIFCTHGGIPRYSGGVDNRLELLMSPDFPRLEYFSVFEDCAEEEKQWIQTACDLCWSDPKEDEKEGGYWGLDEHGFARNTRGAGTLSFGAKAVDTFLQRYGFEYIFRAHQEKSDGLRLSKSARVLTIFSTSDYEGHRNGAALVFVNHRREIRMIIKQPT